MLFSTIFGCGQRQGETNTINKLVVRFPQLQNQLCNYNLIRSVSFGCPVITVKLYSQADSVDDKQQIILITNSKLHTYAIPFFSNTYRDYWNFQFDDTQIKTTKPIYTTFEKQLNTCLDTLQLNDTIGTAGKVVNEILYSLLRCRDISLSDSSDFKIIRMDNKYSVPEENNDSCYKRLERNWESVSQELFPNKIIRDKQLIWDQDNGRVYEFDLKGFKRKQKNYFKLKTFRQDCNWHLMATM